MTGSSFPTVPDKAAPTSEWTGYLRRRYPTEKEWDRVLTSKQERRAGPGYAPLSVGDLVAGIESLLREEIGSDFAVTDANWLAGGASKLQIAFHLDWDKPGTGRTREKLVLRMEPPESAVETSRRREFEILRAMQGTLPVPEARWMDPDARHTQYPSLICGFVSGRTKPSGITSSVTGIGINFGPQFRGPLAKQVVRDMARMHNWDWRSADLPSFDAPRPGTQAAEWNLNHWQRVWEEDCHEDVPFVTDLYHWLMANIPPIENPVMTHNDFRSGNFLFSEETAQITSWLDWELAHVGDRHQELGFFATENMGHRSEDGKDWLAHGLMPIDRMLAFYEQESGVSVDRSAVEYYRVFFCYRAAVIILGTCIRAAMGAKTHQDLTVAWLSAFAYRNLAEAREVLERIG